VYVDNAHLAKAPGGSITINYEAIPQNNIAALATPTGQINADVGGTQSVSVNFTTDTDYAATDLMVTNLGSLPAGWSSSAGSFACAIVSTGSGCQLVLSYTPTAANRGTLAVNYSYIDDSGAARIGTLTIPYATTSANNVIATASPTGQINAIVKTGGQSVSVAFTTDDGKPATGLAVTSNLAALPPGWKSASSSFSCASASTGNGCLLPLTYAPTALASGMLTLTYDYTDSAGTARTGTFNLPYAATTNDNVVATPAPMGQINAVVGMGNQTVSVTFTTDDGRPATALAVTSDLTSLPAGWSSAASSFACAGLSSGTGCQMTLTYAPTAAAAGTLTLRYAYKNDAGESKTGSLNILYRATTNDTVVGTPSPPSLAVLTGSANPVGVVFATDDGNPATAVTITSDLTALPQGWSSSVTSFACATVSAGAPCQLTLNYMPSAVASGTLNLSFSYVNDAGFSKTGTVSIVYRANSDDTVTASAPAPLDVSVGSMTAVSVTFTTSDGNVATGLSIAAADLSALPNGWTSSASSFNCASVSTGSTCQLTLTYAPQAAASGNVTLHYAYTNNAGLAQTGTATVAYVAN
jgi:hypothetical protein